MPRKSYALSEVKEIFKQEGYSFLDDHFVKTITKHRVLCPEKHETRLSLHKFKGGVRCKQCHLSTRRLSFDFVKEQIENAGYKLASPSYKGSQSKIKLICPVGHIYPVSYTAFQQGGRCPTCRGRGKTVEELKGLFEHFGFTPLFDVYLGNQKGHSCRCQKGHLSEITPNNLKTALKEGRSYECKFCYRDRRSIEMKGKKHFRYNHQLSEDERKLNRTNDRVHSAWRTQVFERDNYVCKKCEKRDKNLQAHHIVPWSQSKELRSDVENGVTLCSSCHVWLHRIAPVKRQNELVLSLFLSQFDLNQPKNSLSKIRNCLPYDRAPIQCGSSQ